MVILINGNERALSLGDIAGANYEHFTVAGDAKKVGGEDARMLAATILWDQPFDPEGVPAAVATGRLELFIKIGQQSERKSFLIYNNRILQDEQSLNTFYYASAGFSSAILQLM